MQVINDMICDDPPTREHVMQVYQHQKGSRDCKQIENEKDNVLLARLLFISLIQLKTQFVHHTASMIKTLLTGFPNFLKVMP